MKLETIKKNTIQEVNRLIEDIFISIEESSNNLESVNKELKEKQTAFIELSSDYDRISKQLQEEKEDIARRNASLKEEENNITNLKNKFKSEGSSLKENIGTLIKETKILQAKKDRIEAESKTVDTLRGIKEGLEKDIQELKLNYTEDLSEFDSKGDKMKKDIKGLENDIKTLEANREKELAKILPTMKSLDDRKKVLDDKETGLLIIEKRYKKLYSEQGASFRV